MLEIIPAIDLRNGKAVRLRQGDFATAARVGDDPVELAHAFAHQGAPRLHVVDLDGAQTGAPQNGSTIRAILNAVLIPVQVGGGLRTPDAVGQMLDLGAGRVILGTTAMRDAGNVQAIFQRFEAERIVIGADAANGFVAAQGWTEHTDETVEAFGARLVGLGARRFLFTDITRDGMLEGVNVEATCAFARVVGVPVLASGGVSGPSDIVRLAAAAEQPGGIEGVIIGKALYAGALTLADALRIAKENNNG